MRTALICGISGQDGALLAHFLIEKGYCVVGTSRDSQVNSFNNLKRLNILGSVKLESMVLTDFRSVLQTIIKINPDEVYNLAGQSSVGLSFQQPVETLESISIGTINLLEAIRFSGQIIRLYNAGSSECFGNTGATPANENTPFRPRSPYAVAKAAAFWQVSNYREAYDIHACSGILFNHESSFRPERFVTRKIIANAIRIANGENTLLELGNLDVWRDWGYAPEYVDVMWRMLQVDTPQDYIIATGETHSLKEFVQLVFENVGLDWMEWVDVKETFYRPTDLKYSRADPSKAKKVLGWEAKTHFNELLQVLIKQERNNVNKE